MNAVRHGLLAQTIVLQDENPEAFEVILAALVGRFRPVDEVEMALVEEMAAAQWRKRRSWAIETTMMNDAAAGAKSAQPVARMTHAFTTLAAAPELALMHRYETRQTRMFQRALQNLLMLRKEILPNEPNPDSEHGCVYAAVGDTVAGPADPPVPTPPMPDETPAAAPETPPPAAQLPPTNRVPGPKPPRSHPLAFDDSFLEILRL